MAPLFFFLRAPPGLAMVYVRSREDKSGATGGSGIPGDAVAPEVLAARRGPLAAAALLSDAHGAQGAVAASPGRAARAPCLPRARKRLELVTIGAPAQPFRWCASPARRLVADGREVFRQC
ncbi:unnamed protein product [Prorocentrum cordatum]|uniref:Uncharacterized protein n=1 Tax=Prorocentrum cordatum TaxID=2364126 RepID=A0ABN9RMP8_9DINO|nr:unnamed protein product [Polarella glacialis]